MVSDPLKNCPPPVNGVFNNNNNNSHNHSNPGNNTPPSSSTFFISSSSSSSHVNPPSESNRMVSRGIDRNINLPVQETSRVIGVVLVSDRLTPHSLLPSSPEYCSSRCNHHQPLDYLSDSGGESGLTLGSILLEREVCSCEELRRLLVVQLASAPKEFIFLSKEG